ncbi:hypothetical protein BC939DRAFT_433831 [Gamsiella multidivaricata]|uniref:uncharacterized protein n=1 Tax=Gamsiella multidivaricata TaxID=101098 RepID=UPI00221FD11B|nr:uncharacterized protein BC939DRAFT_433831 [Gamsiella multidivaricata]KAI7832604.1 hypothetical protein BC939DRAFT_433831 [Gamsiella multidivaricata]
MSAMETGPCVCGSYEDVGFMICCDGCESWMHGSCVKITKKFATGIDDYLCPRCKPVATRKRAKKCLDDPRIEPSAPCVVQTSKLLEMSDEILLWILTFVQCQKSICRVSSTCVRLWRVAQDPYLVW